MDRWQEKKGRRKASGVRCRVSGVRCQVSGVRCQVSGVRCQVSGVRCQVSIIFRIVISTLALGSAEKYSFQWNEVQNYSKKYLDSSAK